jgi:acetone carboxylase gamma subunit
MNIVDAVWKPEVNWLIIRCDCGNHFKHRADRWRCVCDYCGRTENLNLIRELYAESHSRRA